MLPHARGHRAADRLSDELDEVAVTRAGLHGLHVYADPLRTMTSSDERGIPTFSEIVQEVPAIVSTGDAARALHPGRP